MGTLFSQGVPSLYHLEGVLKLSSVTSIDVKDFTNQAVVFRSIRRPNQSIVWKKGESRLVVNEGGQQVVMTEPDKELKFKGGVYKTSVPEEIEYLRKCPQYTGIGDKQTITELPQANPEQLAVDALLHSYGAGALINAFNYAYGGQQPQQTVDVSKDPAGATAAFLQGQMTNGNPNS